MAFGIPGLDNNANEISKKHSRDLDTAILRIDLLERQFRELSLCNRALWELLREHSDLPAEALEGRIEAMKNALQTRSNETTTCEACKRTVPADKPGCYYCGAKLSQSG